MMMMPTALSFREKDFVPECVHFEFIAWSLCSSFSLSPLSFNSALVVEIVTTEGHRAARHISHSDLYLFDTDQIV